MKKRMQAKLKIEKKLNEANAQIHVLDEKSVKKATHLSLSGKKNFEYYKTEEGYLFYVLEKDAEKLRKVGHQIRTILDKDVLEIDLHGDNNAIFVAEGLLLSNYQFLKYFKSAKEKANLLQKINWINGDKQEADYLNNTVKAVYWSRDLVNEPLSYLTAEQLSKEIEEKGKEANFSVKVFNKTKIESLKMGGLLAVNKGSIDPPTFTILEYKPKKAVNKKPIVLVGKGVVYDTGGLSLKPTAHSMDIMKSDMGGAACIVGTVYAMALNKSEHHVIALIPATDNRPGQNAYAPGDVITMYDGTTVEVLNTDAEGRLLLGDALAYANKYEPEIVIDAATLTGAAVRAVGQSAACLMGNADNKILNKLEKAGGEVHERLVRFPFWDDYGDQLKSSIADMKNLGGPMAGMITAGKFLEHFVQYPYIHLDIAGPAFLESKQDYKGQGGTGTGVRLLQHFFKHKY